MRKPSLAFLKIGLKVAGSIAGYPEIPGETGDPLRKRYIAPGRSAEVSSRVTP
jgi:hypothetical protein